MADIAGTRFRTGFTAAAATLVLLSGCSDPPVAGDAVRASGRALVARLGTAADRDPDATVAALHEQGGTVVPLLIGELKVIDPELSDVDPGAWWHAVWCERALRSLSGQIFEFRTAEVLPSGLARFRGSGDTVGYFMEWMSHAQVFVAPRDVQARVVAAWKSWWSSAGETFIPERFESYGEWYW